MINMIRKLTRQISVSGSEKKVSDAVLSIMADCTDKSHTDALGNIITLRRGNGKDGEKKKIMLISHIDETGFMVTDIDENGFVRFESVGPVNMLSAAYSAVEFENGTHGVIVPASEGVPAKQNSASSYVLDIGKRSKSSAGQRIKTGDIFRLKSEVVRLSEKRIAGRPLGGRIGAAVLAKAAQSLKDYDVFHDIYFVFSVQKEAGCRGAGSAAFSVDPGFAVSADVTCAEDCKPSNNPVKLGDGAAIKVMDKSIVCDPELVGALKGIALENNIRYQLEVSACETSDISAVQRTASGIPCTAISVPLRYPHTSHEEIDLGDAEECVKLICALARSEL